MKLDKVELTEHDECKLFAQWLWYKKYLFSHIPNATFTAHWGVKMKNKRLGVVSGVPDYLIIVGTKLVFVEMKRKKRSALSDSQKEWIEALNKCPNVYAKVCKGFDEAKKFIEDVKKKGEYE